MPLPRGRCDRDSLVPRRVADLDFLSLDNPSSRQLIFYYCPDMNIQSSGIRVLYRHVEVLVRHGYPAAILHHDAPFTIPGMPKVPVRYLMSPETLSRGDIVVIPEGFTPIMDLAKDWPMRRIAIALNWRYIYHFLSEGVDWRAFNVERVLTNSPFTAEFVTWAMGLPVHVLHSAIDEELYYDSPIERPPQIAYIKRKEGNLQELKRALASRNPRFARDIRWVGLDGLSQEQYAAEIRRSSVFMNVSDAEGLPLSLLEAMRAGTIVAGYNSVGGQQELVGEGPMQNCVLAPTMDYVTLARRLEPLLEDILRGDMSRWLAIRGNATKLSWQYTKEAEAASIVGAWQEILGK